MQEKIEDMIKSTEKIKKKLEKKDRKIQELKEELEKKAKKQEEQENQQQQEAQREKRESQPDTQEEEEEEDEEKREEASRRTFYEELKNFIKEETKDVIESIDKRLKKIEEKSKSEEREHPVNPQCDQQHAEDR